MYNFIEVQPCKNNIGALININLNKINNDIINEIKVSLDEFGVVFFRIVKTGCESGAYVTRKNSIDLFDYVFVFVCKT